jgi:hypothetical protein
MFILQEILQEMSVMLANLAETYSSDWWICEWEIDV